MGLDENLKAAQAAVKYVKSLKIQAINKVSDRIAAAGGIENVIGTEQGDRVLKTANNAIQINLGGGLLGARFMRSRYGTGPNDLRSKVNRYVQEKAGNCQEQAEITMLYLYDNYYDQTPPKVGCLDIVSFTDPTYDHVWVVIDLAPGYSKPDFQGNDDLKNWGPNAVWCDPWQGDGVAFAVSDLIKGAVRNLNFIYKCNTASVVEAGRPRSTLYIGPIGP